MADLSPLTDQLSYVAVAVTPLGEGLATCIASEGLNFQMLTHVVDGVAGLGKREMAVLACQKLVQPVRSHVDLIRPLDLAPDLLLFRVNDIFVLGVPLFDGLCLINFLLLLWLNTHFHHLLTIRNYPGKL